jgi:ribosomal protein S18 acetylase RimI-like enzyme
MFMKLRQVLESDYEPVIRVLNEWWGGRQVSDMLPKLFFKHFQKTSFVFEENGQIIGFLIGFISQTFPEEAYIHFVGVHPEYRKKGIGKAMYHVFFETVKAMSCNKVSCVTSPVNKTSIAYHTRMGFEIEKGDKELQNISIHSNYDGMGEDRVFFMKQI